MTNRPSILLAVASVAALAGALVSPAPALAAVRRAPAVAAAAAVVATDVAEQAGIAQTTQTWSAPVGDVNGDGSQDFFLSRHLGGPASLYVNNGSARFNQIDATNFPNADRLGCVFGDVNQDGLQDLYCSIGDNNSTQQNPKELWIQQPDGTFVDEGSQ